MYLSINVENKSKKKEGTIGLFFHVPKIILYLPFYFYFNGILHEEKRFYKMWEKVPVLGSFYTFCLFHQNSSSFEASNITCCSALSTEHSSFGLRVIGNVHGSSLFSLTYNAYLT